MAAAAFFSPSLAAQSSERPAASPADKIDPELSALASGGGELEVFVLLSEQPQARILDRWNGVSRLRLEIAEGEFRRLAAMPFLPPETRRQARKAADDIVVWTRRNAAADIRAAIRNQQDEVEARLLSLGARSVSRFWVVNGLGATIPAPSLDALAGHPAVARVWAAKFYHALLDVSVPSLGAPTLWDQGIQGEGQSVVVLDSGINANHPAFFGKEVVSRTFVQQRDGAPCADDDINSPQDLHGHGTHVAGIIASGGTAGWERQVGVARGLGTLYSLKAGFRTCDGKAVYNVLDIVTAIGWAVENTASRVFNVSLGIPATADDDPAALVFDLVADSLDVSFAVAAGNEGLPFTVGSPAIAYNVVSVGNADAHGTVDRSDDDIHFSSSRGPTLGSRFKPDLSAPGTDILSLSHRSEGFVRYTGTSMAAPHIAGAMALLRQAGVPGSMAIKALLLNSAVNSPDQPAWREDWGWGYASLERALAWRDGLVADRIGPGAARFWQGAVSGELKATLVWNRHVPIEGPAPVFHNLDLAAYEAESNRLVARSESAGQNVEQVRVTGSGSAVLKVKARDSQFRGGLREEPFALSLSSAGFTPAAGPSLAVACTPPAAPVNAGQSFTVTCTATNNGDLTAFSVMGSAGVFSRSLDTTAFGHLAPGASVSRSWTTTASTTAGSHTLVAAVASISFGETFSAATSTTVRVAGEVPSLRLSTAALSFLAPYDPQTITVTSSGTALAVTAAPSVPWLSVNPSTGSTPLQIRVSVNAASLAPGSYSGTISVRAANAANSPLTVQVSLTVPAAAAFRLETAMVAKTVVTTGCTAPTPATAFTPADPRAYVWLSVTGAAVGDIAAVEWREPGGRMHRRDVWEPVAAAGSRCLWTALEIAGKPPASIPGVWTALVFWNNRTLTTLTFTIAGPVAVRAKVVTKSVGTGNCSVPPAATTISFREPRVWVWYTVDNANANDRMRYDWHAPNGMRYVSRGGQPIAQAGSYCLYDGLDIAGQPPATMFGIWAVKVYWNDAALFELYFIVTPVTVVNAVLTRTLPPGGVCSPPSPATAFSAADRTVGLWFAVDDARVGDRASVTWYSPSNTPYASRPWDPLPNPGSWCFTSQVDISGAPRGDWYAMILWNGNPLTVLPFVLQ